MFSKAGIHELHALTHESLEILLRHVGTVPRALLRQTLPGFGLPTVSKQLVHILTVEEGWVHDLEFRHFPGWSEEQAPTVEVLLAHQSRIRGTTRAYLAGQGDEQLNRPLGKRPEGWTGELRSPAFILLHVITHTFHHKGQIVAMLRLLGHPAPDTDLQRA